MSLKSFEKTDTNTVTMELTVDEQAFSSACVQAYNKMRGRITVPGFRKGKAPKAFIEKYYGEGVFYDDALEIAFPDVYEAAVKESGIEPVDSPYDVDVKSIGRQGVELTLKVTVKPIVEIGEYKGLKAVKDSVSVSEQEVEERLNSMREDNARLVDVDDRAVADGDIVTIDYEGFESGKAFDGGKAEDYDLTIGSGQFIPGFEEQIIGHAIGEEFDINVSFPEQYHEPTLAGKPVVFKLRLKAIKVKELAELDDEFAKDVSEFDTLEELKADIEAKLKEQKQSAADKEFETRLLDMVEESVSGEIPQCMFDKAVSDMVNDMDYRLRMQGYSLEEYISQMGMDEAAVRAMYAPRAEKDVRLMLALEKIAELEGIEATDEDVEEQLGKIAEAYGLKADDIRASVPVDSLKKDIVNKKVIDFIVANAKATAPKKTAKKTAKKTQKKDESAEETTSDAQQADEQQSDGQ